jgi:hypothetical protein
MPSANLVDAYSSSLKVLVFFPGLHLPKLQEPHKKKNFLTNTKKQIGSNNEGKINNSIKEKKKGGARVPPLPKLGDDTHLCPKATKQKQQNIKRGSTSSPYVETS